MQYQLHQLLGQGGNGRVFKAWDEKRSQWVAFKRYIEPSDKDNRKWTPVGATPSWTHPNLVKYYDLASDNDGIYCVMELLEGITLADHIKQRGPLPLRDFIDVVRHTLSGLHEAHVKGFYHKDIKSENIMLGKAGVQSYRSRLFDFTLAERRLVRQETARLPLLKGDRSLFGSIYTMAPEQFNRQPFTARTDLYALGCVLYQCSAGFLPFTGPTNVDVMMAHLHHTAIPLVDLKTPLRRSVAAWVMELLALSPMDRPDSALVALRRFEEALLRPA
ncbi:MAG: serine/threonine protein kinase [Candidatus Methylacidiphilales bacterium]|nr:serine/threonine-protein kinase [Candidatus Methylacidiphilales bacterium]